VIFSSFLGFSFANDLLTGSMLQIYIVIIEKIHFARFTRTLSAAITGPFMFVWSKIHVRAKGGIGEKNREQVALQSTNDRCFGQPLH
jgi:hypothetical protein